MAGAASRSPPRVAPGSAVLTPEATQSLDKVAKALADRPALKMTVLGTAALETEREGYKRERLQALLRAEKRRALVVGGTAADASVQVSTSAGVSDLGRPRTRTVPLESVVGRPSYSSGT